MHRSLAAIAVLALAASVQADDRILLPLQGRLVDGSDQPVSGDLSLRVSLYRRDTPPVEGSSSEDLVWREQVSVRAHDGLFATLLGRTEELTEELLVGERYLPWRSTTAPICSRG